jgi:uncharacterized membrane protein YjfL (UPF0719 family)
MTDRIVGLISGGAHLVLALVLALISTYGAFRIIDRLTRDIDEIEELKSNNIALSIMLAAILLASALIVKAVTYPAISTLQTLLFQQPSAVATLKAVALIVGYTILAVLMAIGSIWIALRCFLGLTRHLDELGEIRKNNVAVAITLGVMILIMGMFLSNGIGSLMKALVPFPVFESIEVLDG